MRKYHSIKFDIVEKEVRLPNGTKYTSSIIVHKPVVVVIPVLGDKILLEKQYRHSVGKWLYELPAGFLNKKISLKKLAAKELHEETGYISQKLTYLFKAFAAVGTSTETYYFYLAENLKKEKQHLEKYEMINVKWFSINEAMRMIKENKIIDAKAI
ncbi:NUDIX hydrolase, partial [Candidatus Marsarchaeota archaeon]|nr:NUDIX hydrolase [Candidatus Marsarchaeota archaeon]